MKYIIVSAIFVAASVASYAQGGQGGNGKSNAVRNNTGIKKSIAQQRGSGQFHGSKDTTPGSPMGTGGAGGEGMSGSPAGSASETAIQQGKADVQSTNQAGSQGSQTKKANAGRKNPRSKNRNM